MSTIKNFDEKTSALIELCQGQFGLDELAQGEIIELDLVETKKEKMRNDVVFAEEAKPILEAYAKDVATLIGANKQCQETNTALEEQINTLQKDKEQMKGQIQSLMECDKRLEEYKKQLELNEKKLKAMEDFKDMKMEEIARMEQALKEADEKNVPQETREAYETEIANLRNATAIMQEWFDYVHAIATQEGVAEVLFPEQE